MTDTLSSDRETLEKIYWDVNQAYFDNDRDLDANGQIGTHIGTDSRDNLIFLKKLLDNPDTPLERIVEQASEVAHDYLNLFWDYSDVQENTRQEYLSEIRGEDSLVNTLLTYGLH